MTPTKQETVTDLVAELSIAIAQQPAGGAVVPTDDLTVKDEVTYTRVSIIAQACATEISKIQSRWKDIKAKAFATHKSAVASETSELAPLQKVKDVCVNNMLEYKRLELAERSRLEREATEKAIAERTRLAREEQAKQAEQSRLEAAAKEARRQGDIKAAREMTAQAATVKQEIAEVKEEAAQVVEEVVRVPAAKAPGVGERQSWSGLCFDDLMYMKAIVDGKFPKEHLIPVRGGGKSPCKVCKGDGGWEGTPVCPECDGTGKTPGEKMVPAMIPNQAVLDHYAKRQQDSMTIPGCRAVQGFGLSIKKG